MRSKCIKKRANSKKLLALAKEKPPQRAFLVIASKCYTQKQIFFLPKSNFHT